MSQPDAPQTDLVTLTGRARMPAQVRTGGGIQKLNWVLDHPAPAELVQGLTTGELYYLMQDIGKGDAYPLVELASDEQLQGVLDIDIWQGWEPKLDRWLGWFDLAHEANLETALRLARVTEPELLQLLFVGDVKVYPKDFDIDTVPDELQLIPTPDGEFWLTIPREHELEERLPGLLKLLFAADIDKMRDVLQTVRFELPSTVTEALVHFRRGRLEEMGFSTPDEARSVYAWLSPQRMRAEVRERLSALPAMAGRPLGEVVEDLALRGVEAPTLLGEALGRLDEGERARVGEALTFLTNKVMMAQTGDLSASDHLPVAGRHAVALTSLGLAYVADESPSVAAEVLRRVWVERLFRVGYSLTVGVGRRARALHARAGGPLGLRLFGEPVDDALEGAARPRPLYFEGLDRTEALTFRELEAPADLSRLGILMDDAEAVLGFFEGSLHFSPQALLASPLAGRSEDDRRQVRLATLFRTALAQAVLHGEPAFAPLGRDELAAFLGAAVERDGAEVRTSEAIARRLAGFGEVAGPVVGEWMRTAVDELVLALGRVAHYDLDPRYATELVLVADGDV